MSLSDASSPRPKSVRGKCYATDFTVSSPSINSRRSDQWGSDEAGLGAGSAELGLQSRPGWWGTYSQLDRDSVILTRGNISFAESRRYEGRRAGMRAGGAWARSLLYCIQLDKGRGCKKRSRANAQGTFAACFAETPEFVRRRRKKRPSTIAELRASASKEVSTLEAPIWSNSVYVELSWKS